MAITSAIAFSMDLRVMMSRGFEEINRAFDIDALIKRRFRQTRPNTRARCQMNNLIEFRFAKKFVERSVVGNVALHKRERFGERLNFADIALLDGNVVERIQVIERPDRVTVVEQPFAKIRPDKPGAACDKKIHSANDAE